MCYLYAIWNYSKIFKKFIFKKSKSYILPHITAFSEVGEEPQSGNVGPLNSPPCLGPDTTPFSFPHTPHQQAAYGELRFGHFCAFIAAPDPEAFPEIPGGSHPLFLNGCQVPMTLTSVLLASALTSFPPLTIGFIPEEGSKSVGSGRKRSPSSQVFLSYIKNKTDPQIGRIPCCPDLLGRLILQPAPPQTPMSRLVLALLHQPVTPDSSSVWDFMMCVVCTHRTTSVSVCSCHLHVWNRSRTCFSIHPSSLQISKGRTWPGINTYWLKRHTSTFWRFCVFRSFGVNVSEIFTWFLSPWSWELLKLLFKR